MALSKFAELYYGKNADITLARFKKRESEKSRLSYFIAPAEDEPCIINLTSSYTRGDKVKFR